MIQRRIIFLFLAAFLAIPALPTAGQTPVASFPPDAQDLVGIQAAVFREYLNSDVVNLDDGPVEFAATPVIGDALAPLRGLTIDIRIYEFDSAGNASQAFNQLNILDAGYQGPGTVTHEQQDLPGIGNQAVLERMVIGHESNGISMETIFEQVTVQRDEYVLIAHAMLRRGPVEGSLPDTGDQPAPMSALASELATNGQPSDDETTFSDDGTSTGGLWGFMPPEDDPLLLGLFPIMDVVLYPAPDR